MVIRDLNDVLRNEGPQALLAKLEAASSTNVVPLRASDGTASGSRTSPHYKNCFICEGLTLSSKGSPFKSPNNVMRLLSDDERWKDVLAFDERASTPVFLAPPPFDDDYSFRGSATVPRLAEPEDAERIRVWLEREHGYSCAIDSVLAGLLLAARRTSFDRVQNYLDKLEWDGVERIEGFAHTYLGADRSFANDEMCARWLISAIARALRPGCQVDAVLILEGTQGSGKSSAFRELFGADPSFFTEGLPELSDKDSLVALQGPWCVEFSELTVLKSKGGAEQMKAFITRTHDTFRAPYARASSKHPRRVLFAGTTNESEYLADKTGNRRFWPVQCGLIDRAAIRRDRDQIWAEALVRFRDGESWHELSPEANEQLTELHALREKSHPWEAAIAEFLEFRNITTNSEILSMLNIPPAQQNASAAVQIGVIVKALAFVKRQRRKGATREYYYSRVTPLPGVPDR